MAHERTPPAAPRRLRRAAMLALPPLAILLLGWLGRFATNGVASAAAPASASTSMATLPSSAPMDGGSEIAPDALEADVAPEASANAIESLPDGGFVVDLNLASEAELQKLPGVGPSRARAIVALRARLGRLKSVDDLARIKGFGRALVRRLRPLVRT